jgi:cytochrome c biogenesis protein CcmG/thiol:disulfide interchange protein DsbE
MTIFATSAISVALMSMTMQISRAAEAPGVRAVLKMENDRKPAPSLELRDASGKAVKLSDYRGQVVLLNFWATWCGGCKVEMPWFQEFETALGPREFAVLGISMDDGGWGDVKPYIEKARVTYRMALADKATAKDYAVTSMPATFIIDRKGRVAATYIGLVDRSDIERNIKAALSTR